MKKKNLIILLLIPFIISLLGIVTLNVSVNFIDADIIGIKWDYKDVEGFKVGNQYRLQAYGEYPGDVVVGEGNELIWSLKNKDSNDTEVYATVYEEENGYYYIDAIKPGEVILTCSNIKGNVFRSFNAIIYESGAILLSSANTPSQNNIDSNIYYGEYETVNKLEKLSIDLDISVQSDNKDLDIENMLEVVDITDNIQVDIANKKVKLKDGYSLNGNEKASFTLGFANDETTLPAKFEFTIVKDGINVDSYEELLSCTNKSNEGEIVVLRKSFESLEYYNSSKSDGVVLFGNYKKSNDSYNFEEEVYRFETKFNKEYIDQWNEFAKNSKGEYKEISDEVLAGLRVQKDFYGNGYTLNFHNLTYPYDVIKVTNSDGSVIDVPQLNLKNLFRGPLPFYTLGDPNGMPLITAFGQDNVGMYVDGDNITINDVNIKNCDFGNSFSNLTYVGTVMDVAGDNVTIKNTRLSNGKNVLRSFSSKNLTVNNCMLSNSRNFLITTGSNEYEKVDGEKTYTFKDLNGNDVNSTLSQVLAKNQMGDSAITSYITGGFSESDKMKNTMLSIDKALNDSSKVNELKGSMNIHNTMFYRSGIASIALETYFNGPYLFAKSPTMIGQLFSSMSYEDDRPIVPLEPNNVSGVSYPVSINISGNTRFYDYKAVDTLDITGLISENISAIANSIFEEEINKITIDHIFPMKTILNEVARNNNSITSYNGSSYFNIPIAYYGGGLNNSTVTYEGYEYVDTLTNPLEVNLLDNYINLPSGNDLMSMMRYIMVKTVTTVTGCEPFKFVLTSNDSELLKETINQAPNVSILIENAKGA
ncbi:MAG: hypothetical protein IJZ77_03190 [Bacilli bacterium]|nr:hypothetical protein [Bacilli bacterium]